MQNYKNYTTCPETLRRAINRLHYFLKNIFPWAIYCLCAKYSLKGLIPVLVHKTTAVLAAHEPFLIKKISHIVEKDSELSQNIWYFVKLKFLKADDLLLLFLKKRKKKLFFILGMAHADPFVVQIGPPQKCNSYRVFFFSPELLDCNRSY